MMKTALFKKSFLRGVINNKKVKFQYKYVSKIYELMERIYFPDNSFDIIYISLALHEMPGEIFHKVLSEIYRVLKSGGKFYIIEWEKPKSFLKKIFFMCSIMLLEPKGFAKFLKINWKTTLGKYGFSFERSERCAYSRLLVSGK